MVEAESVGLNLRALLAVEPIVVVVVVVVVAIAVVSGRTTVVVVVVVARTGSDGVDVG